MMQPGLAKENIKYKSKDSKETVDRPDNFIDQLLKKNEQGNLANLGNKKVIERFYEFIFIMLKLKYIDYQIVKFKSISTEDDPIVMPGGSIDKRFLTNTSTEKVAQKSSNFSSNTKILSVKKNLIKHNDIIKYRTHKKNKKNKKLTKGKNNKSDKYVKGQKYTKNATTL
jgi:hypothetical protein